MSNTENLISSKHKGLKTVELENYTLVDVDNFQHLPNKNTILSIHHFFHKCGGSSLSDVDYIHKAIYELNWRNDVNRYNNSNFEDLFEIKVLREYLECYPEKIDSQMSNGVSPIMFLLLIISRKIKTNKIEFLYKLFQFLLEYKPNINIEYSSSKDKIKTPLVTALDIYKNEYGINMINTLCDKGAYPGIIISNKSSKNILMEFLEKIKSNNDIDCSKTLIDIIKKLIRNTKDLLHEDECNKDTILSEHYFVNDEIKNIILDELLSRSHSNRLSYKKYEFNFNSLHHFFSLVFLTKYSDIFYNEICSYIKKYDGLPDKIMLSKFNNDLVYVDLIEFTTILYRNNEIPFKTVDIILDHIPTFYDKATLEQYILIFEKDRSDNNRKLLLNIIDNFENNNNETYKFDDIIIYFVKNIHNEFNVFEKLYKKCVYDHYSILNEHNIEYIPQNYIDYIKSYQQSSSRISNNSTIEDTKVEDKLRQDITDLVKKYLL